MSEQNTPESGADNIEGSTFRPPTEALQALGELAGDVSIAPNLLEDLETVASAVTPPATVEADRQAEATDNQTSNDSSFEVSTKAHRDLGRDLAGATPEAAEEQFPSNYEKIRQQVTKEIQSAIHYWGQYDHPDLRNPKDEQHFSRFMYDYEGTVDRLAKIKLEMTNFSHVTQFRTTAGNNLGESLHPLLIPWEFMYKQLSDDADMATALAALRAKQGVEEHVADYPFAPHIPTTPLDGHYPVLDYQYRKSDSPADYLANRWRTDGWWGVMLVQTDDAIGFGHPSELMEASHEKYNRLGYYLNGYRADGVGVFEWLALTLQNSPQQYAGRRTLMLANYGSTWTNGSTTAVVAPYGEWNEQQERVAQGWVKDEDISPARYAIRLAIHPAKERIQEKAQ